MELILAFAVMGVILGILAQRARRRAWLKTLFVHGFFVEPDSGQPSEKRYCFDYQSLIDYYGIRRATFATGPKEDACTMELELGLPNERTLVLATTIEKREDCTVILRSHLGEKLSGWAIPHMFSQQDEPIIWGYGPTFKGFPVRRDVLIEFCEMVKLQCGGVEADFV